MSSLKALETEPLRHFKGLLRKVNRLYEYGNYKVELGVYSFDLTGQEFDCEKIYRATGLNCGKPLQITEISAKEITSDLSYYLQDNFWHTGRAEDAERWRQFAKQYLQLLKACVDLKNSRAFDCKENDSRGDYWWFSFIIYQETTGCCVAVDGIAGDW
ncbi:MAG TPA: hypothetical protein VFD58_22230 [Blastocatellia bacterium]|nr:hypothetical protein [Blastocatellia bacterium]